MRECVWLQPNPLSLIASRQWPGAAVLWHWSLSLVGIATAAVRDALTHDHGHDSDPGTTHDTDTQTTNSPQGARGYFHVVAGVGYLES